MKKIWTMGAATLMALSMTFQVFAGSWMQDPTRPANENGVSNWWYQNDDGSYPKGTGEWIDGDEDGIAEFYLFDENGWLYVSTNVNMNYFVYEVNSSGAWTPQGAMQLARGKLKKSTDFSASELTESEVYNRIIALKNDFPEGTKWNYQSTYKIKNGKATACVGFVRMVQDQAFGAEPKKTQYKTFDWNRLRVGDHLCTLVPYEGTFSEHSVIVLEIKDDYITICEGNYNSTIDPIIHWGREITRDELENMGELFLYQETCYEN